MDELSASLDEEVEVLLHVNREKKFAEGVRLNMTVWAKRE